MYEQYYANFIWVEYIHNSILHANKHYAFTISCVQDACLEHAEILGALQNFESFLLSLQDPILNKFELTHIFEKE